MIAKEVEYCVCGHHIDEHYGQYMWCYVLSCECRGFEGIEEQDGDAA